MLAVFNTLGTVVNQIGLQLRKNAPQIMIVGGIVGGVTTTVLACVETAKASEIIGEAKEELNCISETLKDETKEYTEEEAKKDRTRVYVRTTGELAKTYAPAICVGVASTACILGGAGILNNRNAGLAMAVSSSTLKLKKLRDGIIDELGEEEGKKLYNKISYGIKEEEVKEKITDENGKTKTIKKIVKSIDSESKNISYVRVFDWTNPYYSDDPNYNSFFLRAQQNYFNDKLHADGHLFMNDADKALGFPKTKAGQVVGWNHDPDNPNIDNFVDLNVTEVEKRDEYGIPHIVFVLEYNVDGSILNNVNWDA